MSFRSSNKTVYPAKYHLIWRPKSSCRVLIGHVESRLVEIINDVCAEIGAQVIEVEIMAAKRVELSLDGTAKALAT